MRLLKTLELAVVVAALSFVFAPKANAQFLANQETIFTFSQPIELPDIVLPAGSYMFKLANPDTGRNVVQVFNEAGTELYGTYPTISESTNKSYVDEPYIRLKETSSDSPAAIAAWFYAWDPDNGHQFIYPQESSPALSAANNDLE